MKYKVLWMLLTLLSGEMMARDFKYGNLTYTVVDEELKTCATKKGSGFLPGNRVTGKLILPAHPKDGGTEYTLVSILGSSFMGCDEMTSVSIPASVESIDAWAFYGCSGLKKAEFPDLGTLCSIRFDDFDSNPLYNAHHLYIDGTEVTDVVIPDTISKIGDYAFVGGDNIESVTFPLSVTEIGCSSFEDCKALEKISISDNVETIGKRAFRNCEKLKEAATGDGVREIGESAFYMCGELTSVVMGKSVTVIGESAFFSCVALASVGIPSSVKRIENKAFYDCRALTEFTIQDAQLVFGDYALAECGSLESIIIPPGVSRIGKGVFFNTPVRTLRIEDGSESLHIDGESGLTGLETLYLGRATDYAKFGNDALVSVEVGNQVSSLMPSAFAGSPSLQAVTLGSGLKSIPANLFFGCGLREVTIPVNVTEVGENAFGKNEIETINMGPAVLTIGDNAFGDNMVKTINVGASVPPVASDEVFSEYSGKLFVLPGKEDEFRSASSCWCRFDTDPLVVPERMESELAGTVTMEPGETLQLAVTLIPADVSMPMIFWSSTNPERAVVDNKGLVTFREITENKARSEDECRIVARTLYDGGPEVEFLLEGKIVGVREILPGDREAYPCLSGKTDIYTPSGVCIMRDAAPEDMESLPGGIYIAGGKKIVR